MLDRAPEATGRRICLRLCPPSESTEVGDEAFEYALLGKVTRGLDVVERIGRLGNPQNEKPTRRVVIRCIVVAAT